MSEALEKQTARVIASKKADKIKAKLLDQTKTEFELHKKNTNNQSALIAKQANEIFDLKREHQHLISQINDLKQELISRESIIIGTGLAAEMSYQNTSKKLSQSSSTHYFSDPKKLHNLQSGRKSDERTSMTRTASQYIPTMSPREALNNMPLPNLGKIRVT